MTYNGQYMIQIYTCADPIYMLLDRIGWYTTPMHRQRPRRLKGSLWVPLPVCLSAHRISGGSPMVFRHPHWPGIGDSQRAPHG